MLLLLFLFFVFCVFPFCYSSNFHLIYSQFHQYYVNLKNKNKKNKQSRLCCFTFSLVLIVIEKWFHEYDLLLWLLLDFQSLIDENIIFLKKIKIKIYIK